MKSGIDQVVGQPRHKEQSVFRYQSYKGYLTSRLGDVSTRKGLKSQAASHMGCQSTYISQVLHGSAHLSLEQAQAFNEFIGHSKLEANFFLLLVQRERAGTVALREYFDDLINVELAKTLSVTQRLGSCNALNREQQARYYSSWHYAAIHMALTIPRLREPKRLAEYLNVSVRRVHLVLDHLVEMGLVFSDAAKNFHPGASQIRVGRDSTMLTAHHQNLRQLAIRSLDHETVEDLHYSSVVTLSKSDARHLKDRMLEEIGEILKTVRASSEEEAFIFNVDFFSLNLK